MQGQGHLAVTLKKFYHEPREILSITSTTNIYIIFRMPDWISTALSMGLMVTWAFGLLGKYSIFKSIFKSGWKRVPVNMLIFTDQVVNLVHRSMTIFGCAIVLLTKSPLVSYLGHGFCQVFTFVPVFGTCYAIFGSYGITFYRVFIIRSTFKLLHLSQKRYWPIATVILLTSLVVSFGGSAAFVMARRKSFVADLCYGYTEGYLSIRKDYEKGQNNIISQVHNLC